jgi:hypothetical protein
MSGAPEKHQGRGRRHKIRITYTRNRERRYNHKHKNGGWVRETEQRMQRRETKVRTHVNWRQIHISSASGSNLCREGMREERAGGSKQQSKGRKGGRHHEAGGQTVARK